MAGGDDLVVQRLELAHDAPVQHDGRALRRARARERRAEAAGGAGDEDYAVVQRCDGWRRVGDDGHVRAESSGPR